MNSLKIWGAPGTGKTTTLLKEIKREANLKGIENLTITTFRRDVADEIKYKVSIITDANQSALENINTIHGICYNLLGRPEVITINDLNNFVKKYGYEMSRGAVDPTDPDDGPVGHLKKFFNFDSWMKNTCTPLSCYYKYPNIADQKNGYDFKQVSREYEEFKNEIGKIDFTDMLIKCYNQGLTPNTKVLIVDEFQDLTKLQYNIFEMWVESMGVVIIAGDPLQSIYPFWGSSPDYLRKWDAEQYILPISYRLPANVWRTAEDTLRYNGRQETPEIETKNEAGNVYTIYYRDMEYYLSEHYGHAIGTTFHLVRANCQVLPIANVLVKMGIPFYNNLCGWTDNDINLLNVLVKIRNWITPTVVELNALVDNYPMKYFYWYSNKKELKDSIKEAGSMGGFQKIENELIDLIRGGDPVEGMQNTGAFNKKKIGVMLQKNAILDPKYITTFIKTIHGSKGLEANTVFLHTGITKKINRNILDYEKLKDEACVWYVGLSRTSQNMFIVLDKGTRFNVCS